MFVSDAAATPARGERIPRDLREREQPLPRLTVDQVARTFTTGQQPSDLRHWSQLGVDGEWAKHAIHLYGTRDDGRTVTALRTARFGGLPFARRYEGLPEDADVLRALAGDRYGIGVVWFVEGASVPREVRLVPLAENAGAPPSASRIRARCKRESALHPSHYLTIRSAPGEPLDPVVKEYVRLALHPWGSTSSSIEGWQAGLRRPHAGGSGPELAKIE
jgi:phosphate transport system substrate-binding protein